MAKPSKAAVVEMPPAEMQPQSPVAEITIPREERGSRDYFVQERVEGQFHPMLRDFLNVNPGVAVRITISRA